MILIFYRIRFTEIQVLTIDKPKITINNPKQLLNVLSVGKLDIWLHIVLRIKIK